MVRPFTPEDWPEVESWFHGHGESMALDELPPTGFVVPGLAAGWLVKTDARVALTEALVVNPKAPGRERYAALDLVQAAIIRAAKDAGFKSLLAITVHDNLVSRGVQSHGYTYHGRKHALLRSL